jgi:hypothetical protein
MWELVDNNTKESLHVLCREDGEFWMAYKDFVKYFNLVEICYVNYPESVPGPQIIKGVEWDVDCVDGEWSDPHTAGGDRSFLGTLSNFSSSFHL